MARKSADSPPDPLRDALDQLVSSVNDRVSGMAKRVTDYAENGGRSGSLKAALTGATKLAEGKSPASAMKSAGVARLKDKVTGAFGGGSGGDKLKVTNIVESIDVGVPLSLAYAQWTRFTDFPRYMKKVENVEQTSEEKLEWRAQFFEHVGNIWHAQGRRARLELKHFARHAMTESVLHPDDVESWRTSRTRGRTGRRT